MLNMAKMSWNDVALECDALRISRAEMARRAGVSESTFVKGMRRGSYLRGVTRKQVELIIALERQVQGVAP
jgi:DNA-binding MurR/RpiR family transcriptional regulator